MLNKKDIICSNLKILSSKEVSSIPNNGPNEEDDYLFGALTVEGGCAFKKGISIGMQDKMVSGLIIYDNENFYGFSEKYGLSLMSPHAEYIELSLPNNFFQNNEKNKLQPSMPTLNNSLLVDLKDTEKNINKNLNIDIQIKDASNFYIVIPDNYSKSTFTLTFDISFIYDLNSIISNISLAFINNSNKFAFVKIVDNSNSSNNIYYDSTFSNEITLNSIYKINLDVINENNFIISNKTYNKRRD
jgi:hypothetical protein